MALFDTSCYTHDSILSRSGCGISYSTDKPCLCLGCKAALKGATLHLSPPQDWFQLVPTPLCAGLAPGLKISLCQSPLTQTLPGTDRATKFLPFLNWTACSCHPKPWPLWRGEGKGGYVTESSPSSSPGTRSQGPQKPLQGLELQPWWEKPC